MSIRTYQRAFGGGEVTPEFWGRVDDAKYQMGLALCRNFIVKPQGPLENRAGTVFVREVKNSAKRTRTISFTYSTTQTMVIEVGEYYMRFHTQAATLLVGSPSAWVTTTAYAVGDLVSHSGTNYYCTTAHTSGTFATDLAGGKWYALPATGEYEIPTPYAEADLFDLHVVQSADVMTIVHTGYAPRELRRLGATKWTLSAITFASAMTPPTGVAAVATGGSTVAYSYVVTALGLMGTDESVQSSAATCNGNLYASGAYNTITWTPNGAQRYYVYRLAGGVYGYIGQATTGTFKDDNIAADTSRTPPIVQTLFASSGNYPGAVSYFEQRRLFAGTSNEPQKVWATKSGSETNMDYSVPLRDDDSVQFRVVAREANIIRHIVPLTNLLLMTSGVEWKVSSSGGALTPTDVQVMPQSYNGASNVSPVIIANNIVYAAARGGHVREMAYAWQANGYISGDLSLRAPHLFDGHDVVDMAYGKAPYPIVWCVSSSGRLLGITYMPEQQVGAWHQHDTEGTVESVAVVAEGSVDATYLVVKRTIGGATKRYIERIHDRAFSDPEDAFFVDCGATYSAAVAQTLTPGTGADVAGTTGVTFTTGGAVFSPSDVDRYIRQRYEVTDEWGIGTGEYVNSLAKITFYTSATQVEATIITAFRSTATIASGGWTLSATTISGLDHLEGKTVSILGDGAVMPRVTVSGGAITLPAGVHKAQIGLQYLADMETLPAAFEAPGVGQGLVKNVNQIWLRVYRSGGIYAGPTFDALVQAKQRTTEPYGSPPALKTDEINLVLSQAWARSGQVCVRQADPLPLTLVSMTSELSIGGG